MSMFAADELKQFKDLVKEVVSSELNTGLQPIKEDISTLKTDVSTLKTDVSILKKFAKTTQKTLKKINTDQNLIIKVFDERYLELKQQVGQTKQFLHLPGS